MRVPALSGVTRRTRDIHTLCNAYPLRQGKNAGDEATEALPDEVGGDVVGRQLHHEGQEGD